MKERKLKIVIVEEKETIRQLIINAIHKNEDKNYEVEIVAEIDSFRSFSSHVNDDAEIDVVIMDKKLPDKRWKEGIKMVKTKFDSQVIVLTTMMGDKTALRFGADFVLDKPVRNKMLWEVLEEISDSLSQKDSSDVDNTGSDIANPSSKGSSVIVVDDDVDDLTIGLPEKKLYTERKPTVVEKSKELENKIEDSNAEDVLILEESDDKPSEKTTEPTLDEEKNESNDSIEDLFDLTPSVEKDSENSVLIDSQEFEDEENSSDTLTSQKNDLENPFDIFDLSSSSKEESSSNEQEQEQEQEQENPFDLFDLSVPDRQDDIDDLEVSNEDNNSNDSTEDSKEPAVSDLFDLSDVPPVSDDLETKEPDVQLDDHINHVNHVDHVDATEESLKEKPTLDLDEDSEKAEVLPSDEETSQGDIDVIVNDADVLVEEKPLDENNSTLTPSTEEKPASDELVEAIQGKSESFNELLEIEKPIPTNQTPEFNDVQDVLVVSSNNVMETRENDNIENIEELEEVDSIEKEDLLVPELDDKYLSEQFIEVNPVEKEEVLVDYSPEDVYQDVYQNVDMTGFEGSDTVELEKDSTFVDMDYNEKASKTKAESGFYNKHGLFVPFSPPREKVLNKYRTQLSESNDSPSNKVKKRMETESMKNEKRSVFSLLKRKK